MKQDRLDLAVIESRWWEDNNVSVRGLFDVIAAIRKGNPNAYHYEMFNNKESLQEMVPRIAWKDNIKNLCIAAHGDETAIYGAECDSAECDTKITRKELSNILQEIPRNKLNGLYFGSCLTANMDTVEFLLQRSSVQWIAGYSDEIGWLDGASVDLYFWTTYYYCNEGKRATTRIERVAGKMYPIRSLCEELGFNIYVRKRGGGVKALLEYEDDEDYEDYD